MGKIKHHLTDLTKVELGIFIRKNAKYNKALYPDQELIEMWNKLYPDNQIKKSNLKGLRSRIGIKPKFERSNSSLVSETQNGGGMIEKHLEAIYFEVRTIRNLLEQAKTLVEQKETA